ncbi:MAG: polysaccharide deacetylase family protein, partial [Saprospiraceae bacterium]|nr:polysaccharide deacetylase family protein [Saprospiraceae bacterium]
SADDELGIYLSYADSTEYPASGNISVGLKNLTTGSAWAESTGNYDGSYPNTGGLVRLLSGLTCEADIEGFTVYDSHQVPAVLRGYFTSGVVFEDYSQGGYTFGGEVAEVLSDGLYSLTESAYYAHLKTTSDNANYSNVVKSSGIYPLMTSDGVLVVTAYLVNGTPAGADDRLEIRLSSDNFSTKSIIGNVYLKHYKKGWNYLAIPCTKFTSGNGELISSQMNYLNMRLHNAGGGESVEIYIGGIWYNPRARPKLIIDFDDGFDSVYDTAYPYLSSNSLVASVSVIKDRVDTAGYCTKAELTTMYNAGWRMTTHGDVQHSELVTQAAIVADINANKAYVAENFPGEEQHYIYPGGSVVEDISFAALTQVGMATGRRTDHTYECVVNGYGDLRAMAAQPMSHAAGLNALKDYVDDVIRCGLTLVLYGHKVVSSISDANNEILDTDFQLLVDHIALKRDQGLIDVVTRADWYASLDRR